jgi:hypothetical protein
MDIRKTLCMLAFGGVIGLSAQTSGQNYTLSPYSNFGLGELIQPNFLQAGTASQTYTGAYSYSLLNPASLGNLRYATLDFGMNGRFGKIQSGNETQSFNGGSFSYISLAFNNYRTEKRKPYETLINGKPVKKYKSIPFAWNSAIALYPSTSMGYNYSFERSEPFKNRTSHVGSGGVNVLELTQAIKLGNILHLGYSGGYMFGQIKDNAVFSFPDTVGFQFVEDERVVDIKGIQHRAGLLLTLEKDSASHSLGFSYGFHSGMSANQFRTARTLELVSSGSVNRLLVVDTVLDVQSGKQSFTMPASFGVGYQFRFRRSISVALDYRKSLWGNYSAFFNPEGTLANRSDYGVSLTLNPMDEKTPGKKRMRPPLRMGVALSETQNVLTSSGSPYTVSENRAFIGFGIPLSRRYYDNRSLRSIVHFQADYIRRGKNATGLAREEYLVFSLSMNLGDIWFQRRKFD